VIKEVRETFLPLLVADDMVVADETGAGLLLTFKVSS
jgi:hypothetical protein